MPTVANHRRVKALANVQWPGESCDETKNLRHRTLRPFQYDAITFAYVWLRDQLIKAVLLDQPTASGKGTIIVGVVKWLLSDRNGQFTHIGIAAPQLQIEDSIANFDYDTIVPPTKDGSAAIPRLVKRLISPAGGPKIARREAIKAYWGLRGYQKIAISASYSSFTIENLPTSCSGFLFILDEAHHASALKLGAFIQEFVRRGGKILYLTATPDGGKRPMHTFKPNQIKILRRSFAQHAEEGWAPKALIHNIVTIQRKFLPSMDRVMGLSAPELAEDYMPVADAEVASWIADGRPKLIARVPPQQKDEHGRGGAQEFVRYMCRAFEKAGARVFDASGVDIDVQKRFRQMLHEERERADRGAYADSQYDVIIGIQRTTEGTDWPFCAAFYNYGFPSSPRVAIQSLGRGNRLKKDDHPHKNHIIYRCFVETGTSDEWLDRIAHRNNEDVWALCCVLGDHKSTLQWTLEKNAQEEITKLAKDEIDRVTKQSTLSGREFDIETRYQMFAMVSAFCEPDSKPTEGKTKHPVKKQSQTVSPSRKDPTVDEIVQALMTADISKSDHKDQFIDDFARLVIDDVLDDQERTNVLERHRKAIANSFKCGLPYLAVIEHDFLTSLLEEVKDRAFRPGPKLKEVQNGFYEMTSKTMIDMAKRTFGDDRPILASTVRELGENYANNHGGRYPTESTIDDNLPEGETWAKIAKAMAGSRRGLPKTTLRRFFGVVGVSRTLLDILMRSKTPMTRQQLGDAAKKGVDRVTGPVSQLKRRGYVSEADGLLSWTGKTAGPLTMHTEMDEDRPLWIAFRTMLRNGQTVFTSAGLAKHLQRKPSSMTTTMRSLYGRHFVERRGDGTCKMIVTKLVPHMRELGVVR